jgi:hypothetical protein
MLIVIPTSRSISLEYLQPLIDYGARFIIVDDSEGSVTIDHPQVSTCTWKDQNRMLGGDVRAIPRRNGACRDFGFYIAWRESDAGEIVIALDDDCKIEDRNFCQRVAPLPACLRVEKYTSVSAKMLFPPRNSFSKSISKI